MIRFQFRYPDCLHRTAVVLLILWLALGATATVAASIPACSGPCCCMPGESIELQPAQRPCCSDLATGPCRYSASDAAAVQPAALFHTLPDGGRALQTPSGFQRAEDTAHQGEVTGILDFLQRSKALLPLYLQHNSLLC
jgi:hypothetical protein